jgi:protein-tyrosine phosphatase
MERPEKVVLFLCTGNYYRSRFAEHLFNLGARERGLRWRAESAGLAPHCWTRNPGPISRAVVASLARRGACPGDPPRSPRDVSDALVHSAARVVLLSEREHRAQFEERFPAATAEVTCWNVDDTDLCPPALALPRIERLVDALLGELEALRSHPSAARDAAPISNS